MAAKVSIMRVQLDSSAKDRLVEICERRGMTQTAVMSRIMNWFSHQDDYIQTIALHALSAASMAEMAKSLVKKQSSSNKSGS